MNIALRNYQNTDLSFLKEMLYEAVYWRGGPDTPSFEEAFALPGIQKAVNNMGSRAGDAALIACLDENTPVGAAWYRYWSVLLMIKILVFYQDFNHEQPSTKILFIISKLI
jgi:hypothetical protein